MVKMRRGSDQTGRTQAGKISETPHCQLKGSVGKGPSGGQLAPISFTKKKGRG